MAKTTAVASPAEKAPRKRKTAAALAQTHINRALRAIRYLGEVSGLTGEQRSKAIERLTLAYDELEAKWAGGGSNEFTFDDNAE